MRLFDTHVHFDGLLKGADLQAALDEARDVRTMIAVGGSPEANEQAARLAREYPDRIRAGLAYGRHRARHRDSISALRVALKGPGVVAVGETGLDLYHEAETKDTQIALFQRMLELARELRMPCIVHSRNAEEITGDILAEHAALWNGQPDGIGVLHCFTGARKFADRLLDLGFFISFSGILTFKNAGSLRETAASVPGDRLMIETDSPYLAPEPHRGKPNAPAFLRRVAEALALVRNCSVEDIAEITTRNAERLFHEEAQGDRN